MFEFIKKVISNIIDWRSNTDIEKRNACIKDMFSNTGCWKDYPTALGGITGLTSLDVFNLLTERGFKTTLTEVFSYLVYLRNIGYIDQVAVTRDRIPLYIKR